MKEVVIIGPKQFEVREVPVPKPADNEVLIQMKAAGVCGSDVHQFLGENPNAVFPRVPGHENAGVIVEVGKDVKNVKVGDHVVVDLVVACGECPQCRAGRRNVCRQVKARGSAIDGGWREYFAVPEHEVYVMPKELPFRDAALIEPFAIGGHCTARANIQGGETVLVLGSGTIGAVILQTLKVMGFCTAQEGITQAMINTRELSIIGTRMSCNQFQPTIERFARHEFQLDGMVSHYIPFDQVDQVFENIIHPPKDMKKMVILFDGE